MPRPITGKTRLVALLGSPVSHSKSPALQNAAFEALGLDFAYLAFDVGTADVGRGVDALRVLGARGANVTMPLKQAICAHLDALTPVARMAGAVNTVVNEGGVLTGHITDGAGYLRSLDDAGVPYAGRKMTLAGAGGAATAVAIEAAKSGVRAISLFNVRDAFFPAAAQLAALLRDEFGCDAQAFDLADAAALRREMRDSHLFANGTPLGMEATRSRSPITDVSLFHPGLVVTDMVYVPARTRLLELAAAAGCRTVGGLGMQLHQGALSFALWTGREMPLELARSVVMEPA
jgi:shikimate dehydrogenase